ncbi:MAG: acyl-CoA dehydrogenase family protein [Spirochaetota bacterium]|nr:acyl-CoA dehydrogenase family protein [Spirochaetota bacterium]
MNMSLTEEQEMLKNTAKNFLENECPMSIVRDMRDDEWGYQTELWQKMADLGWMGLVIPEEYGGVGGNFVDLTILLEAMGESCLPGPYFSTVVLGGEAILSGGNEGQRREILPKIASGNLILAFALAEPDSWFQADGIHTCAIPDNEDFIINGTKLFVENAHIADYIICVARTSEGNPPEEGLTIFLVDRKSPGIKLTLLKTMSYEKQCEVFFDNVRVSKDNTLAKLEEDGVSWISF